MKIFDLKTISFFLLVQLACVSVFLGRAWQHVFWDAPFRALLWDESIMTKPVAHFLNMNWGEYLRHPNGDIVIQRIIFGFGLLYIFCLIISIWPKVLNRIKALLLLGSSALFFLAFLYCKEKFYTSGQFFEYSLQFSSPLFFYLLLKKVEPAKLIILFKVMIALTFTSHGLYALGIYPVPGNFVQMCLNILPLSESQALWFLEFAGIMDFLISVLIFFPPKISNYALYYAVAWGILTAFARVFSSFELDNIFMSLHQNLFESIYRFPHFIIPLAVLVFQKKLVR